MWNNSMIRIWGWWWRFPMGLPTMKSPRISHRIRFASQPFSGRFQLTHGQRVWYFGPSGEMQSSRDLGIIPLKSRTWKAWRITPIVVINSEKFISLSTSIYINLVFPSSNGSQRFCVGYTLCCHNHGAVRPFEGFGRARHSCAPCGKWRSTATGWRTTRLWICSLRSLGSGENRWEYNII